MIRWMLARAGFATNLNWRRLDRQADSFALPREWVECAHCGAQSWRFPPHAFDPCPLATQLAEAMGIKIDADRSASIRMGVATEQMWEALRERLEEEE